MVNPRMVRSYRYSFLDLPVALADCQTKGCEPRLHHVCQGGYVAIHDIDLNGAEQNICRDCVDQI